MNRSMTGYGRCEQISKNRKISVEIRSVNHRYIDLNIRTPRAYSFLEEYIREFINNYAVRGKVDIYINIENYGEEDKIVKLDEHLAWQYYDAINSISEMLNIECDLSATQIAKFNDVLNIEKKEEDKEALWLEVKEVMEKAGEDFINMRAREGERISQILIERGLYIQEIVEKIEKLSPQAVDVYKEKIYTKIKDMLADAKIEESRILTEVAIFADKVAIDEEIVRLKIHMQEFEDIINSTTASGRKLDFLIQEINREINTIGSKANDIEISKLVVVAKSEIEKVREQVQNIE